jgi:hypothetical protein
MTHLLARERLDDLLDVETGRARRRERIFRDRTNPLEKFNDVQLYERFRLQREGVMELTEMLKADLEHKTKSSQAVPA